MINSNDNMSIAFDLLQFWHIHSLHHTEMTERVIAPMSSTSQERGLKTKIHI